MKEEKDNKKKFFDAIKLGLTNERASYFADIPVGTVNSFISKGEEDEANGIYDTPEYEFYKEYEKAKSYFIMRHVMHITEVSDNGNWQASAWILERCAKEFADKKNIQDANIKVSFINDMPKKEEEK